MDSDRLINLLPEEYLPEPEFKAFPIFAAALIIATLLFVWLRYQNDMGRVMNLKNQLRTAREANEARLVQVQEFIDIQANARFIRSYAAVIPRMVLQAPDYWEIYNEIERLLPEEVWVQGITFRKGRSKWPDVVVDCLSRGYSFNGPLLTYDHLKGSTENPTRFKNLRMAGYRRVTAGGGPAAAFTIHMEVKFPIE